MAINHYFQSGRSIGRASEQLLHEDLIIECMKIYGHEVYYLPRKTVNRDLIFTEDALNKYENAYDIEMYLSNVMGFEGEGDLLTKFGVEIRDTANFIVSRRRWDQVVARAGQAQLSTRPAEGDIIYFPKTQSIFEIRRVETLNPFFQVGKLYVYGLQCELVQYSSEIISTDIGEINSVVDEASLNIKDFEVQLESGDTMLLEYETTSHLILESFNLANYDSSAQNDAFEGEIDILDFTDRNPFGEVYNA
jgi:hypothetical protein